MKPQKEKSNMPQADFHGRITLGNFSLNCFVLNTSQRMILRDEFMEILGSKVDKKLSVKETLSPLSISQNKLSAQSKNLAEEITTPIIFLDNKNVRKYGYEATIVTEYCRLVLKARQWGFISRDNFIAYACEDIILSLANVGITALIDEATGYQNFRKDKELNNLLTTYLSKYLTHWEKRFQNDYYINLFRLKGWNFYDFLDGKKNKPSIVGKITKDIVYCRMAPGLVEELEKLNPINSDGKRASKHHQYLTDVGKLALRDHLVSITTLMKSSDNWSSFYAKLQKVFPKQNEQFTFDFWD